MNERVYPMRKQKQASFIPVFLFMLCWAIAACSPAGEYRAPDVAVPAAYRGAEVPETASGTTSISTLPYSDFFSDAALRSLIDSAVVNNIDLQIAVRNIDYSRQTLNAARLGNLPALNLGAEANLTRPSDTGRSAIASGDKSLEDYTASFGATWEADIWGKIRSRKQSALASFLRSEEAAKAVKTRLVADVANGYYNLLMLDRQLLVTRKNLSLADTTLQMMKLQYEAGQVTLLAVQQQEASRGAIAILLPQLEQKIFVQENALGILCGRMPAPVMRNPDLFSIPVFDNMPAGIPASLLRNRPDVRAAELGIRAAHADMGEAKAGLYPALRITAEGGVNALRSSDWFSIPGSLFGFVQGSLLQPLFQQGQLRAKYEQSKIKRDQAELEFKQTLLKAVGEVSDVLVQLEKLKTEELLAAERAATLRKAVTNAGLLFRSGMAAYLEVMLAQTNAQQAELVLADIRRQHLAAMAELYRALGGGWK